MLKFREFVKNFYIESAIYNVDRHRIEDELKSRQKFAESNGEKLHEDGDHKIVSMNNEIFSYHKTPTEVHSISVFTPHKNGYYIHTQAAKLNYPNSEGIIKNIKEVSKLTKTPVISDDTQSEGAIKMWENFAKNDSRVKTGTLSMFDRSFEPHPERMPVGEMHGEGLKLYNRYQYSHE